MRNIKERMDELSAIDRANRIIVDQSWVIDELKSSLATILVFAEGQTHPCVNAMASEAMRALDATRCGE